MTSQRASRVTKRSGAERATVIHPIMSFINNLYILNSSHSNHIEHLNLLCLNTCGLKSKLNCPDFINFLSKYDLIGLQETKLHDTSKLACKNSSMVDYMISTAHDFGILLSLTVHDFDSLYSDTHCPISLSLKLRNKVYGNDCRQKQCNGTTS